MASIDDLRTGKSTTGMGTASGTDDGVLVIDNPNLHKQNKPMATLERVPESAEEETVELREAVKPKRVAADLSSLPEDEPQGDIRESLEAEILKEGGPFEKYVERKRQEFAEVNDLIDQHNAEVAAERGEDVPTDEELEEMAERGEATSNMTGALIGTKYYDQSDAYGRSKGEVNGSPLEERMATDEDLARQMKGEAVTEETNTADINSDDDEYVDPLEKEIEDEMAGKNAESVEPVRRVNVPKRQPVQENNVEEIVPREVPASKPVIDDDDDIDIDPDENDTTQADSIAEIQEVDEDENMKQFQAAITEKIRPVNKKLNLNSFKVIKNPISISQASLQAMTETAMDWVLPNSSQHIAMTRFSGQDMERLSERYNANSFQEQKNRFKILFDHVASEKPSDLEKWLKSISFNDIDHLYFAAYGAGFVNSHYIPASCDKCKNTFLSDNYKLEELVKYKDDAAEERCKKIRDCQEGADQPGLYVTEFVQLTDNFAVTFRDPSVWNAVFENAILDEKFATKYRTILALCMYIDEFWKIDDGTIQPIGYKIDTNNLAKTVKARVITYGKIIATLSSDQYNLILAYINAINDRADDITYIRPEITCPNCGNVIPEAETSGEELLFSRGQLAALSLTSIS